MIFAVLARDSESLEEHCKYTTNIPEYTPRSRNNRTSLERVQVKPHGTDILPKRNPSRHDPTKAESASVNMNLKKLPLARLEEEREMCWDTSSGHLIVH